MLKRMLFAAAVTGLVAGATSLPLRRRQRPLQRVL